MAETESSEQKKSVAPLFTVGETPVGSKCRRYSNLSVGGIARTYRIFRTWLSHY